MRAKAKHYTFVASNRIRSSTWFEPTMDAFRYRFATIREILTGKWTVRLLELFTSSTKGTHPLVYQNIFRCIFAISWSTLGFHFQFYLPYLLSLLRLCCTLLSSVSWTLIKLSLPVRFIPFDCSRTKWRNWFLASQSDGFPLLIILCFTGSIAICVYLLFGVCLCELITFCLLVGNLLPRSVCCAF